MSCNVSYVGTSVVEKVKILLCSKFWVNVQNSERRLLIFVMSVFHLYARPSVRMEQLGSHWADFHEIWCLRFFFSKICRENSSFIKIWQERRALYMKTDIHFFIISHWIILRIRNVSDKHCIEIKTHILCWIIFYFRKWCRL